MIISFMGCCGAWKNVRCLLGFYSTVLLILLLAEIAIGILVGAFTNNLKGLISPALKDSIKYNYMGDMQNKTMASVAWDAVMYNVKNN